MTFADLLRRFSKKTSTPQPDPGTSHKHRSSGGRRRSTPEIEGSTTDYGLKRLDEAPTHSELSGATSPVDIVFVHGLKGHYAKTWTHENETFWPKDLLPHAIPGSRIFSYGYPSKIFASKSVAVTRDFAKHLLDDLVVVRTVPPRPIIYVCHSLGGIVVKQALITAQQGSEFKDVWLSTKAVVFMGTPHRGSSYAASGKTLGEIVNVIMRVSLTDRFAGGFRIDLVQSLDRSNGELKNISEAFVRVVETSSFQIHITSFYETQAHPLTKGLIVDISSADLGIGDFKPLYLNHQDLCRFSGPQDPNYKKVCDVIKTQAATNSRKEDTITSSISTDYSLNNDEKTCATMLNVVDVADYESKLDPRVERTLEWVLVKPQYSDWTSNPKTKLLWVTGYAGCGKSVLASFISRYLIETEPHSLVCKFFCDEKIEQHRSPLVLLKSIIFQIVSKRKKLWRLVRKAFEIGGSRFFTQFDALWNLLLQIARAEKKYQIIIIIDALDEFEEKAQQDIVSRVAELLSLGDTTMVKVFITSRPNVVTAIDIQACSPHLIQLSLEECREEIDNDIRCVVHHRLGRLVQRGACMPLVRESVEKSLVTKADQTFLWIKFALPMLESRRMLLLPEAEDMLAIIPPTLTALYRHLLLEISSAEQARAAKMLRLLTVCDRPLTGEEIAVMFTITADHRSLSMLEPERLILEQKSVRALLRDLVRIHGSRIELVHQSLRDYLIDLPQDFQDAFAMSFRVDITQDKIIVFEACSLYLSLEGFERDFYTMVRDAEDNHSEGIENGSSPPSSDDESELSTSGLGLSVMEGGQFFEQNPSVAESIWTAVNEKFPLFQYAALHWAVDFAKCEGIVSESQCSRALALCSADTLRFKNWFHYFWYEQEPLEEFPAVIDTLMVVAYFGHTRNLSRLLLEPQHIEGDSLSRALYWAARQGHSACVEVLLLLPHCDPQSSRVNGQPALLAAAQFGQLACVKLLLDAERVNINQQDAYGRTALAFAISHNHEEIVSELLARDTIDINLGDRALNTPLHMAVDAASITILSKLLHDQRAQTGRLDNHGRSILSWAAEVGVLDNFALIMQTSRIPSDQTDSANRTPLSYASQHGHLPIVKKLIATSLPVDRPDLAKRTPLSYASQHGHLSVVRKLIEDGHADPLFQDEDGRNAHSWAAMLRKPDVLRYLTRKFPAGADVPDQNGWTPLAWATNPPGYPDNIMVLIKHGHVNVERKDMVSGRTVLSWVASYKHLKIASELVELEDLDLDITDLGGRTPLSEAAGSGSLEIVELLIATGRVDVNSRDLRGHTPLSWAARSGNTETVRLLLSNPAVSVDAESSAGETALDLARKLNQMETVELLESYTTRRQ